VETFDEVSCSNLWNILKEREMFFHCNSAKVNKISTSKEEIKDAVFPPFCSVCV
jgi:hypothetical protein